MNFLNKLIKNFFNKIKWVMEKKEMEKIAWLIDWLIDWHVNFSKTKKKAKGICKCIILTLAWIL